jgi:hypothetical protein
MNKRESPDSPEQHISDGGGYCSVYQKTTNDLPEEFSGPKSKQISNRRIIRARKRII